MVIALDGTPLSEPTGGVARYTWELARTLAENYPEDQYWLLSDQAFAMPVDRPRNLHAGSRPASAIDRRWWLWGLQREMDRRGAEIFHGTDFSVPYVPMGRPSVMTIHDMSPWIDAEWNHASTRVRWRTPQLLRLGLVKMVITPSETVRRAAITYFELEPERVVAVPLAAREMFHPVPVEPSDVPYLLYVGTIEARKNIDRLMDAWTGVYQTTGVELWITGRIREGFELEDDLPGLHYLGAVDDSELPALFSGAVACVYPSIYEGFGLPVLEAMQCGCPVITTLDPAIQELAADAVVSVPSDDTAAIASAMTTLIHDEARRKELSARGIERASAFHWRETARRTREVYVAACGLD